MGLVGGGSFINGATPPIKKKNNGYIFTELALRSKQSINCNVCLFVYMCVFLSVSVSLIDKIKVMVS